MNNIQLTNKKLGNPYNNRNFNRPESIMLITKGGLPVVQYGKNLKGNFELRGGYLATLIQCAEIFFGNEIYRIKTGNKSILIKRTDHFLGFFIFDSIENCDIIECDPEIENMLVKMEIAFEKYQGDHNKLHNYFKSKMRK